MADGFWTIKKGLNFTGFTMPTNPVDGDVYFDSIQGFLGYENGSWGPLGGSGVINYNTNPSIGSTNGYNLYNNGASSSPTTGTGGTVTNLTFASTTTTPLVGHSMGVLTKAAANTQGEGLSYDFTSDPAFSPGLMAVTFQYQASANFVLGDGTPGNDSDIEMWAYDITNAVLIPVTPYQLTAGVASPATYSGYFQTNPGSTNYRIIWHIATTNANAWTFKLANVFVGPSPVVQPAAQAPISFRASSGGSVAVGAGSNLAFTNVLYDSNSAYNPSTGVWTCPVSGLYIGGSSLQCSAGTVIVDIVVNGGSPNGAPLYMQDDSGRTSDITGGSGLLKLNAGDQVTWNSNNSATYNATSSIWMMSIALSGSVAMPSSLVRLHVSTNTQGLTGTPSFPGSPIVYDIVNEDTYGAYNATTGVWTCPVSGIYLISAQMCHDHTSAYDWAMDIAYTPLGGTQISIAHSEWGGQIAGAPSYIATTPTTRHISLRAGDQIQVQNTGESAGGIEGGPPGNFLDIIQLNPAPNGVGEGVPIGVSLDFMGPLSKVPANYLAQDGSSQLISDYPQLANAFFDPSTGNFAWGSADALHFNLPPGGVFHRAVDIASVFDPDRASRGAVATGGNTGNNVGSYQQNQNLSHNHTGPNVNNTNPGASSAFGSGRIGSWTTDASGGNQSNPNNVYVVKIVKYQ
jgi:hypothetical protein